MYKAIFWDNDGVLVDTEKLYYLANKMMFETIGVTLTEQLYHDNFLVKSSGAWHLTKELGISALQLQELRDLRNKLYAELLCREKLLIEGVFETLEYLSDKYHMSIVTSSRKDHFDLIHRSTDILHYFKFILTGEDFTQYKPHPEPYLMALKRSGFSKEECIIIEDSERGLQSANAAGIDCIIIPHRLSREGNFSGAVKILDSIAELKNIL